MVSLRKGRKTKRAFSQRSILRGEVSGLGKTEKVALGRSSRTPVRNKGRKDEIY